MRQSAERRPSLFASGRRAAVVRRGLAPHWGALLALGLFLIAGLIVVDDYGVSVDERFQREFALIKLDWAMGAAFEFLSGHDKFYGTAFEQPLLLAERVMGLGSERPIYLSRHLFTHLFFLLGGAFSYLLAFRLFRNRIFALFAMMLFLLHPRLYAHAFLNSKDVPFFAAFIIALYLAHRAFRRGSLPSFALLGVWVGILVNLRIMGVVLLVAVLAMRGLDLAFARGRTERKRILLATGAFTLAFALVVYALSLYLWADPLPRAFEWWTLLSDHPITPVQLFQGAVYLSSDFPARYLPVWFMITGPPFALLLGMVGAGSILARGARSPMGALRNTRLRFALLALVCFAAPVLAVVLLDANMYHGWRQMYFLWAPFSLLSAFGLQWTCSALRGRLRLAFLGAAAAGLAAALASMAMLHPNQQVSFNFLADRVAPERLATQYEMDYSGHSVRQALEWALSERSSGDLDVVVATFNAELEENARILPAAQRERITLRPSLDALIIRRGPGLRPGLAAHQVKAYGSAITSVERNEHLREIYDAARRREPILESAYDVHHIEGYAVFVKEPCTAWHLTDQEPLARIVPVNRDDLPYWRRDKGFEPFRFHLSLFGAAFDGKCVAWVPLPDYPIAQLEVVFSPELMTDGATRDAARQAEARGLLLGRAAYDVYLVDGELAHLKEPCGPLDTEPVFYLDAFPIRASDLPQERREVGFDRFHFRFHRNGAFFDGACAAFFPLPDYPVAAVRTGQRAQGGGDLWSAAFSTNPEPYRAIYRATASSEPVAQGAFDIHLADGALVYVKEPCGQADTEDLFFLHIIPERAGDLPEARREFGFDNLDFRFFLNGARFDGKCAARVPLPEYPLASIRTGQHVSGDREIWSAEFAIPDSPERRPVLGQGRGGAGAQ